MGHRDRRGEDYRRNFPLGLFLPTFAGREREGEREGEREREREREREMNPEDDESALVCGSSLSKAANNNPFALWLLPKQGRER